MIRTIGAIHGCDGRYPGAEKGAKLMKKYLDIKEGIMIGPEIEESTRDITALYDFSTCLRDEINQCLAEGYFTIVFGGDHSIAIGSIAGILLNDDYKTGVIYFDAHADMNTFATSPSGNIHGMPLAVCMGEEKCLKGIMQHQLPPEHLLLIGQRSLDSGEKGLIETKKIRCHSSDYIKRNSLTDLHTIINDFIESNHFNRLHISFDIDVIDPEYAPGTGVPEPDGIDPDKAIAILGMLLDTGIVHSIDIVEYNPILDINDKTLRLCQKIIDNIYYRITEKSN